MNRAAPLLSLAALALVLAAPASAGLRSPDDVPCNLPERSSYAYSEPSASCQYRFSASGALDEMTVLVTLRDCFDVPVEACSLNVTLTPNSGTLAFCSCEGTVFGALTDAAGVAQFSFSKIGGRGSLDLAVTARCVGNIGLDVETIEFTTPDLNASCEQSPASSTSIPDLGIWAAGLSVYQQASDYDCDGSVGIVDLGIWASGLATGCGD
jgi:hypothetical protein